MPLLFWSIVAGTQSGPKENPHQIRLRSTKDPRMEFVLGFLASYSVLFVCRKNYNQERGAGKDGGGLTCLFRGWQIKRVQALQLTSYLTPLPLNEWCWSHGRPRPSRHLGACIRTITCIHYLHYTATITNSDAQNSILIKSALVKEAALAKDMSLYLTMLSRVSVRRRPTLPTPDVL